MKPLHAVVVLGLVLPIGAGDTQAGAPTPTPLAGLVLPRSVFGRAAAGLEIELISGETSNDRAALESFDPSDTAASLAKAGRISGFRLIYGDLGFGALRRGSGLIDLGTSLDYFTKANQAAAYARKALRDLRRARGQNFEGVVVERVTTFPVRKLGPAATGIRVVQRIGNKRIYSTYVDFHIGRLIAEAAVRRADASNVDAEAITIAQLLGDRILRYSSGQLRPAPVTLPRPLGASRPGRGAPNLQAMVFKSSDLKPAIVVAQGYAPDDNAIASYFRQFRLDPRAGLYLLRNSVALERSREEAAGRMLILRSTFSGPEAAAILAGLVAPGATAPKLEGPPRGGGIGEESFRVAATFTSEGLRLRVVLVHVRREGVVGTLIVVGKPNALTTSRIGGYGRTLDKALKRGFEKPKLAA